MSDPSGNPVVGPGGPEAIRVPPVVAAPTLGYAGIAPGWEPGAAVYVLPAAGLPRAIVRAHVRQAVLGILPIGFGMAVPIYFMWSTIADAASRSIPALLTHGAVCIVVFAVMIALRHWSLAAKVSRQWTSFRLVATPGRLTRTLHGFPEFTLTPEEVTRIVEYARGLILHTKRRGRFMLIPKEVEGYAELREMLATWRPITRGGLVLRQAGIWAFLLGYLAVLATAILATNRWLGLVSCAVVIVTLIWSGFAAVRSPNVPTRTKWSMLFLVVPGGWLAVKLVMHLIH